MEKNEIVLFESKDGKVTLPVPVQSETVWLTRMQMADLFGVTPQNITIHLRKVYAAGELDRSATSKDFLLVQSEGSRQITRSVNCYNLDAIISVGYRVNSSRATQFRIWATQVIREFLLRGYAINRDRMRQLGQTVEVMKRVANSLDVDQVLDVVNAYSTALDLLDGYDHQTIGKPKAKGRSVELSYEECRQFIDSMRFAADSPLFGNEKDGSFKSALGAVYQSFGGEGSLSVFAGEGGKPAVSRDEEPRLFRWQQENCRRTVSVLPEAQQTAPPQGRLKAHRRSHTRRAHRDDR